MQKEYSENRKKVRAAGKDKAIASKKLRVCTSFFTVQKTHVYILWTSQEQKTWSFIQIGEKLGIDPSKDKELTLYKVLHENLEGDLPAVDPVTSLNHVSPCPQLW